MKWPGSRLLLRQQAQLLDGLINQEGPVPREVRPAATVNCQIFPTGIRVNDSGRCGPVGPVTWDREAWRSLGHIVRDLRTGLTRRPVGALNPRDRERQAVRECEDEN